jgi:glutamate dehydrogenase (NAD(P)+)
MVHERLNQNMTAAFHAVHNMAQAKQVNNRIAAYLVRVAHVAQAIHLRGWV